MVELEGSEKLFGMVLGMVLILMPLKCLYLLGSSMASLATSSAEEPPSRWFFCICRLEVVSDFWTPIGSKACRYHNTSDNRPAKDFRFLIPRSD